MAATAAGLFNNRDMGGLPLPLHFSLRQNSLVKSSERTRVRFPIEMFPAKLHGARPEPLAQAFVATERQHCFHDVERVDLREHPCLFAMADEAADGGFRNDQD